MLSENKTPPQITENVGASQPPARLAYVRPELRDLGDIRDITLGPSPALTDSIGQSGEINPNP